MTAGGDRPPLIGTRLGPFQITAKLGEGGMGEVYRATDSRLKREVAIKVLPAEFTADRERLARFEREAQLLAQLQHPNIASIYGLEEAGGVRGLVMELVDGEELSALLARGALPVDEALAIARQIVDALEAAHEQGIVHRDLKPGNVKVRADTLAGAGGTVKVLDFGLAKALDAGGGAPASPTLMNSPTLTGIHATELGMILGTAAYMAPEQARGKAVDKRADVWAFGVVLHEMLTGRRLFSGESLTDTLAGVLRNEIDFSALPAATPHAVRRLLERCLERNPKNRLRDIGEARVALAAALAFPEQPVAAAAPAPPVRALRSPRWRLAAVAAVGVALGGGLVALLGPAANDGATAPELRITPITSSGNVISAAISPDGRFLVYVESEQGLQSLWLLQLAGGQTLRLIPDQPVSYWGHTFTRDGNNIYFGQRNESEPRGALYSISTLGGAPKRLFADIDSSVSFSPDGREMAFLRNGFPTAQGSALMVARVDGSEQRVLAQFELPEFVAGIFFGAPAWSPDGERIATAIGRRASEGAESRARLALVAVADGAVETLADPGWLFAAQADWLPDGKSLAVIARGADQPTSQIWSVSFPAGAVRRVTSDLNDHRIVSLTADGRVLVSITGAISSNVWSVPRDGGGTQRRVSRSTYDGGLGVAFASAKRIVYTANVGGSWGLWAAGLDGAERGPLFMLSEPGQIAFPAIAADGTVYVVVRDPSGIEIRAIAPDAASSRTIVRDGPVFGPIAVTPDGRFVIYAATVDGMPRLQRIGVAGGPPDPIFEWPAVFPALDSSGTRVAFYYYDGATRVRLGVKALAGGPLLVDLPVESAPGPGSRLALRDEGIYVNTVRGDTANVWLIPAEGGAARRVTAFNEQSLEDFAVSEDGATLAVTRGTRLRDAYAITGFAGANSQ